MPATKARWLRRWRSQRFSIPSSAASASAFPQRVEHAGGGRVMILAAHIVGVEQQQIQVPGQTGEVARASQALQRPRRNRHGRKSRRAAQPFLRATVGDVDAVLVHHHGHAAQRGDAIGDHQRVHFVRGFADGLGLVVHAGGGLGLHERHHARALAANELAGFLRVERLAPRLGQAHDFGALAARHFPDAVGEEPVAQQRELAPGSAKLATAASMPELPVPETAILNSLRGGIDVADQPPHLVRHLEEERIEMPHEGLREGLGNARRHHARARGRTAAAGARGGEDKTRA